MIVLAHAASQPLAVHDFPHKQRRFGPQPVTIWNLKKQCVLSCKHAKQKQAAAVLYPLLWIFKPCLGFLGATEPIWHPVHSTARKVRGAERRDNRPTHHEGGR
jgi:hypothetical protein